MRLGPALAVCAVLAAAPARAQQGSVQVTAAAQTISGPTSRTLGQPAYEPDFGVSWLQPGTRVGTFQVELRGTRRGEMPHLGKAFVAARDVKYRGLTWALEAGDTYFSPLISEYRFTNLPTPSLTFAGVALKGGSARMTTGFLVGRVTALRNLFGSDADTLDQTVALGHVGYKTSDRLNVSARASRVRTGDVKEVTSTITASDQAGGAVRFLLTPALHLVGDGSVVLYQRRGETRKELDGSALAGASFLHSRGWVQVNVSRFSPGELPVLSQPLTDRQMFYASGEYDLFSRVRSFGGWEAFRTNLDPQPSTPSLMQTATNGTRAFGGVRVPIGTRSSLAVRAEGGDRRSKLVGAALTRVSDTGMLTAEWQASAGAVSGFARYSRRDSVEASNLEGSYTVHDTSGHLFYNVTQTLQLFGNATTTRTTTKAGGGNSFWQVSGGGQTKVAGGGLWLRGEGTMGRNVDLLSDLFVPQEALNVSVNGEILRNTILGFNLSADRLTPAGAADGSWVSRTSLRVTRNFTTGSPAGARSRIAGMARHGGTGSVEGFVFNDWNVNGRQDPGEDPVENIPIRLATLGHATTAASGAFAFLNVPIGLQQVGIDQSALPVDFDPPAVAQVQLQLGRGETRRVAFGLIPLGAVGGRVVHDANGNGRWDEGDTPLDGAVVVLDGGARSEQQRKGRFRFEAVRSRHSHGGAAARFAPDGAAISGSGPPRVPVALTRERAVDDELMFLVTIQARPEVRRVFASPPAGPAGRKASTASSGKPRLPAEASAKTGSPIPDPRSPIPDPRPPIPGYAVQIAAFDDPFRARALAAELKAKGLSPYLIEPPASDPNAPYRVRVGRYATRDDAKKAAGELEQSRGGKLWVIREITER